MFVCVFVLCVYIFRTLLAFINASSLTEVTLHLSCASCHVACLMLIFPPQLHMPFMHALATSGTEQPCCPKGANVCLLGVCHGHRLNMGLSMSEDGVPGSARVAVQHGAPRREPGGERNSYSRPYDTHWHEVCGEVCLKCVCTRSR